MLRELLWESKQKHLFPHRIEKRTMKACVLRRRASIESLPLALEDVVMPEPSAAATVAPQ
jgi:hypothetical protein